jgi:hypothetical protein
MGSGVEDARLLLGEIFHEGDCRRDPHRNLNRAPPVRCLFRSALKFAGYFMPSSPIVYGIPVPLHHMAEHVLTMNIGEFVAEAREMSGLDFGTWWANASDSIGLASTADQLTQKYSGERQEHVTSEEGREVAERVGFTEFVRMY